MAATKRLEFFVFFLLLTISIGDHVYAGLKQSFPVTINKNGGQCTAYGAIGSARNSNNISSYVTVLDNTSSMIVVFRDDQNNVCSCTTDLDTQMAKLRALTISSYLYIATNDTSGECDNINKLDSSFLEPPTA